MSPRPWFLESLHAYRLACVSDAIRYPHFTDARSLVQFVEFVSSCSSVRKAYERGTTSPGFAVYEAFTEWQAAQSLPVVDTHGSPRLH